MNTQPFSKMANTSPKRQRGFFQDSLSIARRARIIQLEKSADPAFVMPRKVFVHALLLVAFGLPFGVARLALGQQNSLDILQEVAIEQKLDAQVPLELTFLDEQGHEVKLAELFAGKPVILNLAYYRCPMLCHLTRNSLVETLRTMEFSAGQEFNVLTVSFDPEEGPPLARNVKTMTLDAYDRPQAAQGWHFLTGKKENIAALANAVGFRYAWDERNQRFAHAAGIMVLTPEGRVSRYLNGVEFASRDLRLALVEASAGKIGSPTDQVLLLCYHYDPTRGKYGLAIQNALRIGGVLTLLGLAMGIGSLVRRERRRQQQVVSNRAASDAHEEAREP